MREIKFRAWDKVYKQMSPEFVLFGEFTLLGAVHDWQWEITGKGPGEIENYSSLLRLNDLEVMQFTGLKDKNGKEIYEGDRLGFTINFSDESARAYWSESGFTGLVYWDKSGWAINEIVFQKMFSVAYVFSMQGREFDQRLLERYSKIKSKSFDNITDFEVIGNIYENHDLL